MRQPKVNVSAGFEPGRIVNIYNQQYGGRYFFEGKAEVLKQSASCAGYYTVRFLDDNTKADRFVDPAGQGSAVAWVIHLNGGK